MNSQFLNKFEQHSATVYTTAELFAAIVVVFLIVRIVLRLRSKHDDTTSQVVNQRDFESRVGQFLERRDSKVSFDFRKDFSGTYRDPRTRQAFSSFHEAPPQSKSNDDFLLSLAVGYATNSSILGWAAGGSALGGFAGASLSEGRNDRRAEAYEPSTSGRDSVSTGSFNVPYDPPVYTQFSQSCSQSETSSVSGGDSGTCD